MKFLDEAIVRLYLRTSCNKRGERARDERGKLKTSLDNGKRLVDRNLPSRHH